MMHLSNWNSIDDSGTAWTLTSTDTTRELMIGKDYCSDTRPYIRATLDELWINERTLTPQEIQAQGKRQIIKDTSSTLPTDHWGGISTQLKNIVLSWIVNPIQQTQVGFPSWIKLSVGRVSKTIEEQHRDHSIQEL